MLNFDGFGAGLITEIESVSSFLFSFSSGICDSVGQLVFIELFYPFAIDYYRMVARRRRGEQPTHLDNTRNPSDNFYLFFPIKCRLKVKNQFSISCVTWTLFIRFRRNEFFVLRLTEIVQTGSLLQKGYEIETMHGTEFANAINYAINDFSSFHWSRK